MKRTLGLMVFTVVVATGATLTAWKLSAQQAEIKRTELLRTELPGVEGKEAVLFMSEIPPGVVTGKHRHPGSELVHVLEGSYVVEVDGKGAIPLKAGDSRHAPPGEVHAANSLGSARPTKVLVFLITEKGQPLAIPVP